ncbi:MAG: hypothetical protein MMC33_005632 [Icmadophila ericetorum]|nr:hypothetical protein [Icmadophila ericetorum]
MNLRTLTIALSNPAKRRCTRQFFSTYSEGLKADSYGLRQSVHGSLLDVVGDVNTANSHSHSPNLPTPTPLYRRTRLGDSDKTRRTVAKANNMAIQDVSASILEKSSKSKKVSALEIHQHNARKWKPGDVYAPHDLSAAEMKRWMYKRPGTTDAFDVLGIDPLKEYKNYMLLSEYQTSMGRILPAKQTGLRNVNQRKIAKAIRRAIGMGFMPSVHKHPEMLRR